MLRKNIPLEVARLSFSLSPAIQLYIYIHYSSVFSFYTHTNKAKEIWKTCIDVIAGGMYNVSDGQAVLEPKANYSIKNLALK